MKPISPAAAVVLAAAAAYCTEPGSYQGAAPVVSLPVMAVAEAPPPGPSDIIQEAAQGALHELAARGDTYRKNPSEIRSLVDEYLLVSEEEIAAAMRLCMETHHQLVEGASGVAVAGFLQKPARFRGQRVAIVLCGGNISLGVLKSILP